MRRVAVPERLDADLGTPEQVQSSLADLRMLNRWFGGTSTAAALLKRISAAKGMTQLSLLDVAGASGDVAAGVDAALAPQGVRVQSVVLDQAVSHLSSGNGLPTICGSALHLPFRDSTFDVVGCSLFLHHLEPSQIGPFLREAMRCARIAVMINDLRRSLVHWIAAGAGRVLYRSPLTAHDAPASVRRAYTARELRHILVEAGYPQAEFTHHYFYRIGIVIWRADVS